MGYNLLQAKRGANQDAPSTCNYFTSVLIQTLALACLFTSQASYSDSWDAYGGGAGGGQYSDLDQINRDNIDDLKQAWEFDTGDFSYGDEKADPTAFEVNPIFANDSVYICSPFGRAFALDPGTGEQRWVFDAKKNLVGTAFGFHVCRGVSYWEDKLAETNSICAKRVFMGTTEGQLIALDADTGLTCPGFGDNGQVQINQFNYINEGSDTFFTSPPAVLNDRVIVGGAISSYANTYYPNGIVRALDARSGQEIWHWNPLPQEMRKILGGVNVWPPMAVDEERGLVFLPTGSPTVDSYGAKRPNPIPFANSVVALNGDTGETVWNHQIVHHDLWDYDMPAQPILVDIQHKGETVPAVIQNTKMGLVYVFNRETGEPLFPIEERAVPQSDIPGEHSAATQPFPVLPKPLTRLGLKAEDAWGMTFWDKGKCRDLIASYRSEGLFTPPSIQGTVALPNGFGGSNWGNASYHPGTNMLIVASTQIANVKFLIPREASAPDNSPGATPSDAGGPMKDTPYSYISTPILSPFGAPCTPPPWGRMTAIDMDSGEVVWKVPFGAVPVPWAPFFKTPESWGSPLVGGPMSMAGGLVFAGASLDKKFRALDLKTGEIVWRAALPAPGNATPMTYSYKGKQYIVIAAGGNAVAGTALSGVVVAFALDD